MNRNQLIVGFLALAVITHQIVYHFISPPRPLLCSALASDGFLGSFRYMALGSELCREKQCSSLYTSWDTTIAYRIFSFPDNLPIREVAESTARSIQLLSRLTNTSMSESSAGTRIAVIVVSEDGVEELLKSKLPNISGSVIDQHIAPGLKKGLCSGVIKSQTGASWRLVRQVYVFVPGKVLTKGRDNIDNCILEELTNSAGLFRDPPQAASLFDGGNFGRSDGRISLSFETEAMIGLLYSMSRSSPDTIETKIESECGLAQGSIRLDPTIN